ncbi:uncharacterized protein BT62DRAFT_988546 [Guyanagaster necrorhizus]|uniref:Wax synthase domain-containing protein n=1 Tax=Guyanagaster necrorhizus TaxID=856835 RepID=A0A9P7VLM9_9AGAR|nr:uncharacterized protein BT62DRAFT_988546 [Guyanagaster necrorhizus MCA 3950]KAG7442892.1 hypothetical protein BT62DRAFT_988546 [Guyanagaster necrorhizus MCA 3950]
MWSPPQLSSREPPSWSSVTTALLPSLACYYVSALLTVRSYSFLVRMCFLPITLGMLYRCSVSLDMAYMDGAVRNDCLNCRNETLLAGMTFLGMRAIAWTVSATPPRRLDSKKPSAMQLCFTGRYHEWNLSSGLHVPAEWRPTNSRTMFVLATLAPQLIHTPLSPNTFGSPTGGTIFTANGVPDLHSTYITLLSGIVLYSATQSAYDACANFCVFFLQRNPTQWPSFFDRPWQSTSLHHFWAKGWHQFVAPGGRPLYALGFGRTGAVLGSFTVSSILHISSHWGLGRCSEWATMGGYFIIQGVGVVLEGIWKKVTGYRVGGILGWLWTVAWVVGWGNIVIDAWARAGLIGSVFFPNGMRPITGSGTSFVTVVVRIG